MQLLTNKNIYTIHTDCETKLSDASIGDEPHSQRILYRQEFCVVTVCSNCFDTNNKIPKDIIIKLSGYSEN
jgi:hypothetical protein